MKKGNVFLIAGLLLIAAALALIGYNLWDDNRAGKAADEVLVQLVPLINTDPVPEQGRVTVETPEPLPAEEEFLSEEIEYPDYVLNPEMDMPLETINGLDYIGVLSIPAIDRELPVLSEWDYSRLKVAPCRYSGSAYLDTLVICAHNYGIHFGSLKNLSYGDFITFTDMDGNIFSYRVSEIETLQPSAVKEMTSGEWDLTLFTCTFRGEARVAVRCEKVEP